MVSFYGCHFVDTAIQVVSKNGITTFCEFRGCFYVLFKAAGTSTTKSTFTVYLSYGLKTNLVYFL